MKIMLACLLAAAWPGRVSASTIKDDTAARLDRYLNAAANASTGGQTDCEPAPAQAYDRRMNVAFGTLMRKLPAPAARRLRMSQQA